MARRPRPWPAVFFLLAASGALLCATPANWVVGTAFALARAARQPVAAASAGAPAGRLRGLEARRGVVDGPGAARNHSSAPANGVLAGVFAAVVAAGAALRQPAVQVAAAKARAKRKKGVREVDGKEIPWNVFLPKGPLTAKIVSNHTQPHTLTENTGDPNWQTAHITIDTGGQLPYVEGQSIGIVAPGPDKKGEVPAKVRLYSIASSAGGDDESGRTVSICVKRNVELDGTYANRDVGDDVPDTSGTQFPTRKVYRGVCSNYVCDLAPGAEVLVTGPTGAEMMLPEDPEANLIMIATGTGIAPMRSYLRRLFHDKAGQDADGTRKFKGKAWLFLGVPRSGALLYDKEHQEYGDKFPDQFRYDYAVSREQSTEEGDKMYIQSKMAQHGEELWELMQQRHTHVYMCGLKGMERGMEECFGSFAQEAGMEWATFQKAMKKDKRYHVEVY